VNKTWNRRYVVAVEACKVMLVYSDSALKEQRIENNAAIS